MSDTIVLKKYANRRLYDTSHSGYVTLEQVAAMIKDGHTVKAEDAKTGEDVTAFILTQIVLEEARRKNILLPAPLLHVLIRYGDNLLGDFFDKYLEQTLNNYLAYKSRVDEQFKRWLDFGLNFSEIAQKSVEAASPFSFFGKKDEEAQKDRNKK
jgi:polyhydroxyalkanoate synthesis repressor PhaR